VPDLNHILRYSCFLCSKTFSLCQSCHVAARWQTNVSKTVSILLIIRQLIHLHLIHSLWKLQIMKL